MNKITECEEQTMIAVWSYDHAPNLGEIVSVANERLGHLWAPQTVSTFLARLIKKGYLISERNGRSYYYTAKVSIEDYRVERIKEMVKLLYEGDRAKAVVDLDR